MVSSSFHKKVDTTKLYKAVDKIRKNAGLYRGDVVSRMWVTPPVTVSKKIGIDTAAAVVLADMKSRYAMKKGIPSASLPQIVVDPWYIFLSLHKKLLANSWSKQQKTIIDNWLQTHYAKIYKQLKQLWLWYKRDQLLYGCDETVAHQIREYFLTLYKHRIISQKSDVRQWCRKSQSVVADHAVTSITTTRPRYHIRFFIDTKKQTICAPLFHIEHLFGAVAIAVNPLDKRYKKFIGKKVIIPIINKTIPLITDERIDMTYANGARILVPAHDRFEYSIAQDHELPLDKYAVDQYGIFTEHAGEFSHKPAEEFIENIIRYLQDISNLDSIETESYEESHVTKTGEKTFSLAGKQRFFDPQKLQEQLDILLDNEPDQTVFSHDRMNDAYNTYQEQVRTVCVSRQSSVGLGVPVCHNLHTWTVMPIILSDIISMHATDHTEWLVYGLLAVLLQLDRRLDAERSIDEFLSTLQEPSMTADKPVYKTYLWLLRRSLSTDNNSSASFVWVCDSVEKIFDMMMSDMSVLTSQSDSLYHLFQQQLWIRPVTDESNDELFSVDYSALLWADEPLILQDDVFDVLFVSSVMTLLWCERLAWDNTQATWSMCGDITLSAEDFGQLDLLAGFSLFSHKRTIIGTWYLTPDLVDATWQKLSYHYREKYYSIDSLLWTHGWDAMRLFLLASEQWKSTIYYDVEQLHGYTFFLHKIWNIGRFVHTNYSLPTDIDRSVWSMNNYIQQHLEELKDIDLRMLHKILFLHDEISYYAERGEMYTYIDMLMESFQYDFCDLYAEMVKTEHSPHTWVLLHFVYGQFLHLLHPFAPMMTEKLRNHVGYDSVLASQLFSCSLEWVTKNYKFNLLMDIIAGRKKMRREQSIPAHESVSVAVQANRDFLESMQVYETTILTLLNASMISYLSEMEQFPDDMSQDRVVNIMMWLKHNEHVVVDTFETKLQQLEKDHTRQIQLLQSTRSLLSNISFTQTAEASLIAQKKEEMNDMKKKVTDLEYQIHKLRAQKK